MQRWPCLSAGAAGADGSRLAVVVTPNAPRTRADGLHDGHLRVRLAAPPVDGKANAALLAWLAAELGLQRRDLQLLHGAGARRKRVALPVPQQQVAAWLERVTASPQSGGYPEAAC